MKNNKKKILEVRNLKKYFKVGTGKTKILVRAVDDISFTIYEKDVFGLVGESGCGKTTASRTIIRLYRPTSGEVTFKGTVIGSGNGEYYDNLARARKEYRINKIQLDSRKKAIYDIKQKYALMEAELKAKKQQIEAEHKEELKKINEPIQEYKITRFKAKNKYNLERENAHYRFINLKNALYGQTINEELHEYEGIKKNLEKTFKIKYDSLDDSVGLSVEAREQAKENLTKIHEEELLELEEKFKDAIEDKSQNLLPKEEYKAQLRVLHNEYAEKKASLKEEYKAYVSELKLPDYVGIKEKRAREKEAYKNKVAELAYQKDVLSLKKRDEIKEVGKDSVIETEKLEELKIKHQEYVASQRELIKESRKKHRSLEAKEQTKKMQMIFQDPISSLNPRMTVGEIVSEGLVINGEKDKELIQQKVIETLDLVGLAPEYISRYPHEFSGGQRQRIGIARALIMQPSFIIADEPISALDVSIRAQVLNLLTDLKEKLDLSILFIAHDLSVVRFFCDRIAVMYYGKIVELAPTTELFAHPLHPYTKSLLSAVPQPDPDTERHRKRIHYNPFMHDYSKDKPKLVEIKEGHFVYANKKELEAMKKELGERNA